jgi:hypothetical protein
MMRVLTILFCAGAFGIVMGSSLTGMMMKDPVMADTPAPVAPAQTLLAQVVAQPIHKNLHSLGLPQARATKVSIKSIKAGPMLTSHHTTSVARSAISQHD